MKTQRAKFITGSLLTRITFLSVVSMATVTSALAQTPRTVPQRDLSGTERQIRSLEIQDGPKKDAKTIMDQINEDFGRLRVINDEIKKASASGATLNYKSISEASAEIKKRATRLKANLSGLPKADTADKAEKRQKENVPLDETQMRALLSSLNGTIASLVSNPVFSDMGSLDNRLAVKASQDIEGTISLSESAKKAAEKLGKRP